MRVFVAVWPPLDVRDGLEALDRPEDPAVRWAPREQWHVTLRFLGDVDDGQLPAIAEAVDAVASAHAPRVVALGPATRRLGRGALVVPVAGLDDLGTAVEARTAHIVSPDGRPYRAHLTLARARGKRPVPRAFEGMPITASWMASEIAVVRSHLGAGPARYETLATAALVGQ